MWREVKQQLNESKLIGASKRGEFETVKKMVESERIRVDVKSFFTGRTPLMHSTINGYENIAKYLVDKGANVELNDFNDENTLVLSLKNDRSDSFCKYLLEFSTNLNCKDEWGRTLLQLSIIKKREKIFYMLLEQKVELNNQDNMGKTPLMMAAEIGNLNMFKELVSKGANMNVVNFKDNCRSLTDYAVENNHPDILNFIIRHQN